MNDKMNWKNVLTIGGAYTAYCIGAGFASGQETLQYTPPGAESIPSSCRR